MNDRVEALLSLVDALRDPASLPGRSVREGSLRDAGVDVLHVEHGWGVTLARYDRASVEALALPRWRGRSVKVILGQSVFVAPLRAIALPLLEGAEEVLVRASRAQPHVAHALVRAMAGRGLPVREVDDEGADVVIAYGQDETLRQIADALPVSTTFVAHGHGFGVALWGRTVSDAEVAATALDVARYDQLGCLSPQCVLTLGDALEDGRRLWAAMQAVTATLPFVPLGVAEGARVTQWVGRQAIAAERVWRGAEGVVVARRGREVEASPGHRAIAVVAVASWEEALTPLAPWVTVLGVAGDETVRVPGFSGRIVKVGAMQDPPLDGPEDVRRR